MTRHRGQFDPTNPQPYELSRSKVEAFIRCPACFWLDRVAGVKFPTFPPFNLNSNTDKLLKRDFDSFRGQGPNPLMTLHGLEHLRPFAHEDFEKWCSSLHFGSSQHHFNTVHAETNILFGGGVDDIWENTETGELHVVDYKSTSNQSNDPKPVSLEGKWKESYKRQMDMYQWILRRKGLEVSPVGYFVYVDGLHVGVPGMLSEDPTGAVMQFQTSLLTYEGDSSWVESTLSEIKGVLLSEEPPQHDAECEFSTFLSQCSKIYQAA